ncbi:MAG: ribosomal protein L7/L12 [Candidatus Sericytochromatia bacterium]|nr:ribosomal protein L7/L12 [Candidatus Sericytochromatia bacterium]
MAALLVSALITLALLGGVLLVALPFCRLTVGEGQRLVVFRGEEVHRVEGPGPRWVLPGLERWVTVSVRPQARTLELTQLQAQTGAWMSAVLRVDFVVLQPERAADLMQTARLGPAVDQLVRAAFETAVGTLPPERLIEAEDRRHLGRSLKKAINETALGWGLDITAIDVAEAREVAGPAAGAHGTWQVVLVSAGEAAMEVAKALTRLTDLGLLEARELVEAAPAALPLAGDAARAEACRAALEEAGATVALHLMREEAPASPLSGEVVDVVLQAAGGHIVDVIKVLRRVTGWDLGHAKAVVDQAPYAIMHRVRRGDAEEVRRALEAAGASVELV